MAASCREERENESKSRHSPQEVKRRGSDRDQEQVPEDGRGHLQGRGEVEDQGEEVSNLEGNKEKQINRVLFFNARSIVSKVDLLQTELKTGAPNQTLFVFVRHFAMTNIVTLA